MEVNKIKNVIEKYDIISFDIFEIALKTRIISFNSHALGRKRRLC